MPVKGRKPSPDSRYGGTAPSKQPRQEWVEVVDKPYDGVVPKLPTRHPAWPARIKEKWKVWSRMPHCVLWDEADWEFALDSLEIAAQFYETGQTGKATELRNREKQLGTTLDFRRDLRIRYVDNISEEKKPDEVADINAYRNRVG